MPEFSWLRFLRSLSRMPGRKPEKVSRRVRLEQLEDRLAPATFQWSGAGANSNWSTGANWVGGVAPSPTAFADLDFPTLPAGRITSTNNDLLNASFRSITFSGPNYTLAGNPITLG